VSRLPELVSSLIPESKKLISFSPHIWQASTQEQSGSCLAVIFTGPSGVGKDTIVNLLNPRIFRFFQTVTSRSRRPTDKEGAYHWVDDKEFGLMERSGIFLETNLYAGSKYGTPKSELSRIGSGGGVAVLRIENNGLNRLRQMRKQGEPVLQDWRLINLMIVPPSLAELRSRLTDRDGMENVEERWALAEGELAKMSEADYIIVNEQDRQQQIAREIERLVASLRSAGRR